MVKMRETPDGRGEPPAVAATARHRWRPAALAAALLAIFGAVGPARAVSPFTYDVLQQTHPQPGVTEWQIYQPDPTRQTKVYPMIRFQRGDEVVINAMGCVQTGGYGRTSKRYVNPLGGDADHLYSGTIYIPGAIPLGADGGYQRIGGQLGRHFIPTVLPPTIPENELYLRLGYQDDNYSDNSYGSQDSGNDDQCVGQGNALVTITIRHHEASATGLTPWSKPFDLTWKVDSIDPNGLPLNPLWAGQIDPNGAGHGDPAVQKPDFVTSCGGAFSWNWLHHALDEDVGLLAARCTSQEPTTDFDHSASVEPCCYCHPQPLSGHLDWAFATYTGAIYWSEFSGHWPSDNDLNFNLAPTGAAGLTDQNGESLGLEFDDAETVDNFTQPWWVNVRNLSEAGSDSAMSALMDGRFAVVTGLVNIDGVHGGSTEVHPVMAMAVCIDGCTVMTPDDPRTPIVYGADQTWVFFVQNYGRGGNCSSSSHFWPGLPENGDQAKPWYFLSLPWHPGASAVGITSQDIRGARQLDTASPDRWRNFAYIGFQLPPQAAGGGEVDGQFTLHYTLPVPAPARKPIRAAAKVTGHPPEGAEWADVIAKVADPAVRARLDALVRASPPAQAPGRPHLVRLRLAPNPRARLALAAITEERARRLTRDRPTPDPIAAAKSAFHQQLVGNPAPSPAAGHGSHAGGGQFGSPAGAPLNLPRLGA